MKQLYTFLLVILPILAFAQCPDTPIVLSSQADVDNFSADYPGCTDLNSAEISSESLTISGSDITDLSPLSSINTVVGLVIEDNPILTSLDGLNLAEVRGSSNFSLRIANNAILSDISSLNVTEFLGYFGTNLEAYIYITDNPVLSSLNGLDELIVADDLVILNNDSLTSLVGLENLFGVSNYIRVSGNDQLINLSGFNSLDNCNNFIIENNLLLENITGFLLPVSFFSLEIEGNDALQNLNGLENMISGWIRLENNAIISDISAINSLNFAPQGSGGGDLYFRNNPNLSACDVSSVCTVVNQQLSNIAWSMNSFGPIIENNASGCADNLEVFTACGSPPLNDDCVEVALNLPLGDPINAINLNATQSSQTPSCNDVADRVDVWFKFNYPTSFNIDILVDPGYSVQLWQGSCASLTQVASACSAGSLFDIPIIEDTDYYVQVWSSASGRYSSLATGLFNITAQVSTLSLEDVADNAVKISPNPVLDKLSINAPFNIENLAVYNIMGQLVSVSNPNAITTDLDMSQMASGIYLVKIKGSNSEQTVKVVKK